MRSRFQKELSGELGEFWKKEAEKELEEIRKDIETGNITIDEFGVARNKIGRVVMSDMLERILYVAADRVNEEATKAAREAEVSEELREYKERMKNHVYSAEEIFEMRAAFGTGTTVVDCITGRRIAL